MTILNSTKEAYFDVIQNKHNLQAIISKHTDFIYNEAQWVYSRETIEAMENEVRKLRSDLKNLENVAKTMREENAWSLQEMAQMRKEFAAWGK